MGIYVETFIQAPLDRLWQHTQEPDLHAQWDLRFTSIEYLPKNAGEPQRFRYATRIGFGMEIAGTGETVGECQRPAGERSSSLKFESHDPRSLIREGAGYWKYIPAENGVRFLTWYDYRTRCGCLGAFVDRVVFRPLMGWATAWSFDRLRLWVEQGVPPGVALRQFLIHACARIALIAVFAYHGLVPKLWLRHADELTMLSDAGVSAATAPIVLQGVGIAELLLAFCLLVAWRRRWPAVLVLILMSVATLTVAVFSPHFFGGAFNPATLNISVAALAMIDWLTNSKQTPSAARCLRSPPREES
jgi:uncharacterized membrane protein YphA (DoxX/SURF4 family)